MGTTALTHPGIVSKLVLVSSGFPGREVAFWLCLSSLPVLGELLTNGPVDSTGFMLRRTLFDKSLATRDLGDELRSTNDLSGGHRSVLKISRNFISLRGVKRRHV